MMLSPLKVLTLALATATAASASLSATQITTNINVLTTKSQDLQKTANSITLSSGVLIIINSGPFPRIIKGFAEIITTATVTITQLQGTQPFTAPADQQLIADALIQFVEVHQALLSILIGKAGLITALPVVGTPISQALTNIEVIVDRIAFALISLIPGQKSAVSDKLSTFKYSVETAISQYSATELTKKRSYPISFRG